MAGKADIRLGVLGVSLSVCSPELELPALHSGFNVYAQIRLNNMLETYL